MKDQILQFRAILDQRQLSIDDFELNVDGEAFRSLMAGGAAELEVVCRTSSVARCYRCDGSDSWLTEFLADLDTDRFR